jgi:hypothetical protein
MNHINLRLITFSKSLHFVFIMDIVRYPDVLNLFFPSLGMGIIQLCFQLGGLPEFHIKLKICSRYVFPIIGKLCRKEKGIPFGPGLLLLHLDSAISSSVIEISELMMM